MSPGNKIVLSYSITIRSGVAPMKIFNRKIIIQINMGKYCKYFPIFELTKNNNAILEESIIILDFWNLCWRKGLDRHGSNVGAKNVIMGIINKITVVNNAFIELRWSHKCPRDVWILFVMNVSIIISG